MIIDLAAHMRRVTPQLVTPIFTERELDVMALLRQYSGRVVPHARVRHRIERHGEYRAQTSAQITHIRRKLAAVGARETIVAVRGEGYRHEWGK